MTPLAGTTAEAGTPKEMSPESAQQEEGSLFPYTKTGCRQRNLLGLALGAART